MSRKSTRRGIPAALVLANGLGRHGRHCSCRICRAEYDVPALTVEQIDAAHRDGIIGKDDWWHAIYNGHCSVGQSAKRRIAAAILAAPALVMHNRISHAAHYMYGTGGHDLDRWVIRSIERPAAEKLAELGVAADAAYHSGYVHNGQQHWIYTAIRPLSVGVACPTCDAEDRAFDRRQERNTQ